MLLGAKIRGLGRVVVVAMLAGCATAPDDKGEGGFVGGNASAPPAVAPSEGVETAQTGGDPTKGEAPSDADPEQGADPTAPSPAEDPALPAATQSQLVERFAPRLHLHPDDTFRPANVDWYLARVSMRYNHPSCPDHELLALGKVTQAALAAQTHADDKLFCVHDGSDIRSSASSDSFFLEVASSATYKGAPRAEWKPYVVWRPKAGGLIDIEYWAFYPYNDGFLTFNHEADWEHVMVSIDPKANGGQGKALRVFFSAHKGGGDLERGRPAPRDGRHASDLLRREGHARQLQQARDVRDPGHPARRGEGCREGGTGGGRMEGGGLRRPGRNAGGAEERSAVREVLGPLGADRRDVGDQRDHASLSVTSAKERV